MKLDSHTSLYDIKSGVPQGSVLGPILYTLCVYTMPRNPNITIATFADYTALLALHVNSVTASQILQNYLSTFAGGSTQLRIKVEDENSAHVTFSLNFSNCPQNTEMFNTYLYYLIFYNT